MENRTDLEQAIANIGIEKAEEIIAQMKAKPKWDADKWFTELTEGMQLRREPSRPNVVLWDGLVNGERVTLFEQDLKCSSVWCRYMFVWSVLEVNYSEEFTEVQAKLKVLFEEHLKWKVETAPHDVDRFEPLFEEHLKWKVETARSWRVRPPH